MRRVKAALWALGALSWVGSNGAIAQTHPAPPADISELTAMFSELCMRDFPDMDAVTAFIVAKNGTVMTPSEVTRYLHTDPGRGWYVKTPVALYGVTIEDPPFHTCAIRRMTPEGAASGTITNLAAAERTYASAIGGRTVNIGPTNQATPNGVDVLAVGLGVVDGSGKPSDTFGVFQSNYHGRAPQPWAADATNGVGVEIRLTRQVIGR